MLLQTANASQLCTFVVQSSISEREKKTAGVKKTLEAFKTPVVIKIKCTRPTPREVQLQETSLTTILQTTEFSLVLFVVVTHDMWTKQRKILPE